MLYVYVYVLYVYVHVLYVHVYVQISSHQICWMIGSYAMCMNIERSDVHYYAEFVTYRICYF